jgi:hypothetical protein
MEKLLVKVDKKALEAFIESHGSRRKAMDFLALRIDSLVRSRRRSVPAREEVPIEIPLRPNLLGAFDEFCVLFNTSKKEVVNRIIKQKTIRTK